MLTVLLVFSILLIQAFHTGDCSSLLCGRAKEVELGEKAGAGSALALSLVRPFSSPANSTPCQLRLTAPEAAAFTVRLIDVKQSMVDLEQTLTDLRDTPGAGASGRGGKWSGRSPAHAQDTSTDGAAPLTNATDACKMLIHIGDAKTPIWRLSLCGGNAAQVAAKAGSKLLPPKIKIVWNPPNTPYQHTEKLRLVVTAVNSGAICNNETQFVCGVTSLCISSYLVCDGVRHCPGGEDEDSAACSHRRDPPFLELMRRFAAKNQELLGLDQSEGVTKPSVIMKIGESEQKPSVFSQFKESLSAEAPWSYFAVGMFICAGILMFLLVWECFSSSTKHVITPVNNIPPACVDMPPTVSVTSTSQQLFTAPPATPPEYEAPPSYSSLFPRAFKSSPTPVAHCSHEDPSTSD